MDLSLNAEECGLPFQTRISSTPCLINEPHLNILALGRVRGDPSTRFDIFLQSPTASELSPILPVVSTVVLLKGSQGPMPPLSAQQIMGGKASLSDMCQRIGLESLLSSRESARSSTTGPDLLLTDLRFILYCSTRGNKYVQNYSLHDLMS